MRHLEYGRFVAEQPAFDFTMINGRSILTWIDSTNQEGTSEYNLTDGTQEVQQDAGSNESFFYRLLIKVDLDGIRAELGQVPILIHADLNVYQVEPNSGTWRLRLYRMLTQWEPADSTNRYADKSSLITWHGDAYGPYPSVDHVSTADYDSGALSVGAGNPDDGFWPFPVTSALADALADGADLDLLLTNDGDTYFLAVSKRNQAEYPHFSIYYFLPVEFYQLKTNGDLDLQKIITNGYGEDLYLGSVERGETGQSVGVGLRNYSPAAAQIEVLDDHPEADEPVQITGTGTGALLFVDLVDSAVSQRYVVQFYSGTQFEVQALSYADNVESLHPQINADASWRGAVGSTFTAPDGGLVIPPEAWQKHGINTGDEFEAHVIGNSTDTDWPPDSNLQIEMANDNGSGSPDASTWRPIKARRARSTAAVTISAASVFVPLRRINPSDWPAGADVYIMDEDNIDEGTVSSAQDAEVGSTTHNGSGLDDIVLAGNYSGTVERDYRVEIDATGTPDTVKVSRDGGSSFYATGIALTGSDIVLENGVYIAAGHATTGHTLADYWQATAKPHGVTIGGLSVTSNAYAAGARVGTALPVRDVASAVFTRSTAAAGASQSPASRIYLEDPSIFSADDVIAVQAVDGTYEEATVDTVGATYIDLDATLSNDFPAGSLVTELGVGEAVIHLRPAALVSTLLEVKRARLNARF